MKKILAGVLSAASLTMFGAAHAAPISVTKNATPFTAVSIDLLTYGSSSPGTYLTWDSRDGVWTFCAEPVVDDSDAQFLPGTQATFEPTLLGTYNAAANPFMQKLYGMFYGTLIQPTGNAPATFNSNTNRMNIAAFQVLVWEFMGDVTQTVAPNLLTGNVKFNNPILAGDTQTVYGIANTWLTAINAQTNPFNNVQITFNDGIVGGAPAANTQAQGFLSFVPIPAPGPFALFLVGALAFATFRRKR